MGAMLMPSLLLHILPLTVFIFGVFLPFRIWAGCAAFLLLLAIVDPLAWPAFLGHVAMRGGLVLIDRVTGCQ